MLKKITTIVVAILFLNSCGTPNDPENYTGGYKIEKKVILDGYANDVLVDGNYCYVAQGESGLAILDVTNPKNPTIVSSFSEGVRGYSAKVAKKENTVYLAAGGFGITVIDVETPSEPSILSSNLAVKPSKNFYVMDDYLITAISELGFNMSNIENSSHPDIRGTNSTDGYARGVFANADKSRLFVATGEKGLSIFDISVIDDGYGIYPLLNSIDLPGYAESVALDESKKIAYIASGNAGLQVIDYSDETNLKIIGNYVCPSAKELVFENNKVYIVAGGLHIIDVSQPSNPKALGIIDTEHPLGITVTANYIYVADKEEGLIIVGKK